MQWFRRVRATAHIWLWTALIASFLVVSLPKILRGASKYSIHLIGPFHSTDSFLHFDTGEANGSERLLSLFESVPLSGRIVIFVRNDDRRSGFIGMLVAYLAWPHPVRIIDVTRADSGYESAADFQSVGAYVFCRVDPPPWWPRGERLGKTLEVLPAAKLAQR